MKQAMLGIGLILALGGCSGMAERLDLSGRLGLGQKETNPAEPMDPFVKIPAADPALAPETTAPPPPENARTAEALDTTTPEQRAAATAPESGQGQELGRTAATLGSPTEPGLWLKTPLVTEERQGRVTYLANGKSSLVTLIPISGPRTGGSRLSLAAMRLIGAPLTDIAEVSVALEG